MNDYDAARDYFEHTVKPTVQEFLADTTNVRRCRLAAIVLYHTWDYLGIEGNRAFRDSTKPDFLLTDVNDQLLVQTVRAAADASKHFKLDNKHIASNASQVLAEHNPGLFGAPFGEGCFAEANDVHLILDETEQAKYGCKGVSLVTAVKFMLSYWEQRLSNSGQ